MTGALLGIGLMAVLFVIAGAMRLRGCDGHCAGCSGSCGHYKGGDRHAG